MPPHMTWPDAIFWTAIVLAVAYLCGIIIRKV